MNSLANLNSMVNNNNNNTNNSNDNINHNHNHTHNHNHNDHDDRHHDHGQWSPGAWDQPPVAAQAISSCSGGVLLNHHHHQHHTNNNGNNHPGSEHRFHTLSSDVITAASAGSCRPEWDWSENHLILASQYANSSAAAPAMTDHTSTTSAHDDHHHDHMECKPYIMMQAAGGHHHDDQHDLNHTTASVINPNANANSASAQAGQLRQLYSGFLNTNGHVLINHNAASSPWPLNIAMARQSIGANLDLHHISSSSPSSSSSHNANSNANYSQTISYNGLGAAVGNINPSWIAHAATANSSYNEHPGGNISINLNNYLSGVGESTRNNNNNNNGGNCNGGDHHHETNHVMAAEQRLHNQLLGLASIEQQRRIQDIFKGGLYNNTSIGGGAAGSSPSGANIGSGGIQGGHDFNSTRIGLNLGGRTYFSAEDSANYAFAARFGKRFHTMNSLPGASMQHVPLCQAEGCKADLSIAKHYHRRHKVCEYHSKASTVVINGNTQRFCQQCSRFHALPEFDEGKRSCRKRLADHNRRRRKPQAMPTAATTPTTTSSLTTSTTPSTSTTTNTTITTTTTTTTTTPSGSAKNDAKRNFNNDECKPTLLMQADGLGTGTTTTTTTTTTTRSTSPVIDELEQHGDQMINKVVEEDHQALLVMGHHDRGDISSDNSTSSHLTAPATTAPPPALNILAPMLSSSTDNIHNIGDVDDDDDHHMAAPSVLLTLQNHLDINNNNNNANTTANDNHSYMNMKESSTASASTYYLNGGPSLSLDLSNNNGSSTITTTTNNNSNSNSLDRAGSLSSNMISGSVNNGNISGTHQRSGVTTPRRSLDEVELSVPWLRQHQHRHQQQQQQQHNNNTTNTMDDHHVADSINIASHVNVSANNPNKLVVDGGELVGLPSNVSTASGSSSMILTNNIIRGGMNAGLQIYNMNAEEHGRLLAEHIQSLQSASRENGNYNNNNNNNNNNNSDDGDDEENGHHNKANDHMILHPHGLHMGTKLWEQSPNNPSGSDNNTHVLSLLETSTLSGQNHHHLGFLQHHHHHHHHHANNHHANHINIHEDLDLQQPQQHLHPYHHNAVPQGILRPLMNVHESLHTANATGINTSSSSSSTTATSTADFMKDGFV